MSRPRTLNRPRKRLGCVNTGSWVYIGRGSVFGNSFVIGPDGTRDDVCDKYAVYAEGRFREDTKFRKAVLDLRGKNLACYCAPKRCHGDWLIEKSNV